MDKKKPLSQLKTVGHGITIFPADACGKYDGFAENAKQRGRNQAMKFLSRFFAVLPFRNAKLPAALLLCLTAWMLSAATQADFKEFLPPARLVHNGSFREGIAALEQIAPRNPFATAALYLIYSRGYCGESVNYRKAAQYLDSLFGTHFHNREWLVFWSQKRFPQVDDLSGVILQSLTEGGFAAVRQRRLRTARVDSAPRREKRSSPAEFPRFSRLRHLSRTGSD